MRCKHPVEIPSSKDFGYIEWHAICPHISSSDPENLMAPIIKCLLSHRDTASCEKCIGLRQSRSCTTEFEIQLRDSKLLVMFLRLPTGSILVLEGVPTIQSGRNILHILIYLTCMLPNSRLEAFSLRLNLKNTKTCKTLIAMSKETNRFHSSKELLRVCLASS